jgi:hypothetical protein
MQRVTTSGPHLFFESFAVSRLKLYFAKVLQWNTHICPGKPKLSVFDAAEPSCLCEDAAYFAYASNNDSLTAGYTAEVSGDPNAGMSDATRKTIGNKTLGADMRLSLSTFGIKDIAPSGESGPFKTLLQIAAEKRTDSKQAPWGALIPFHTVDEWNAANPFSREWCVKRKPVAGSIGDEMCKEFDRCAEVAGGLGGKRPVNQLGFQGTAEKNLRGKKTFSMCFVFAGNLFTRSDNSNLNNQSLGLAALDNPAVVGLAVATARFVDNRNQQELTCNQAAFEMNRSVKVNVNIYTALNADMTDGKKQTAQKSVREITGEKLGVASPNCLAPNRGGEKAVKGDAVCLQDPTWIYQCSQSCLLF